jgi:hypothetical protein
MKSRSLLISILAIAVITGCSEARKQDQNAKADAEAKARADMAKKEMDTLPKVFRSRDIFKKVEPTNTQSTTAEPTTVKKS